MTEKERALQLSRQIDRLLADKPLDQQLSSFDESAIQIANQLAQVMQIEEERRRENIRRKLLARISPETRSTPLGILFNWIRQSIFVQFTGWAVPALVLFTLLIYPVRMDHLQPGLNSSYLNPPASSPVEPAHSRITVTESTPSLGMPDPAPTPLAGSSYFISTLPTAQLTNPGMISIGPAHFQVQTPKPAPLATDGVEP